MQPKYRLGEQEYVVAPVRRGRDIVMSVDGHLRTAQVQWLGENELELTVDGVSRRVFYAQDERRLFLHLDGREWSLTAIDEFQDAHASGDIHGGAVIAPMPGVVVEVSVQVGEKVSAGQNVILIESMKLQCELRAKNNGTVKHIAYSVGASFERGAVLLAIEPEQADGT